MTVIIDYGAGNLFSLRSSFEAVGERAEVSSDKDVIMRADRLVLPGVGAFGDAAAKLRAGGLDFAVREFAETGKPLLGICLGMQLLYDVSYEFGKHKGLGLLRGEIVPIADVIPKDYKIPHIGWNRLSLTDPACRLWKYIKDGDFVYFVHSFYAADRGGSVAAVTEYGAELTAAASKDNIYGCQFHPEKSGEIGLSILRAFSEL